MRILLITCLLSGLVSCSAPSLDPLPDTIVETESGRVTGLGNEHDVVRWFDIPYAQAPIGELRWKAPRKIVAAQELLSPSKTPVLCPQQGGETSGFVDEGIVGDEDCLYLDVISPSTYKGESHPVMFWIHGGGNTSGYKGTYDFSALAEREQVVVVTINYRLGPLGWFIHPALKETEGLSASGNFGTLDIIAALEWTQRNIREFGGDPDNVTIFGESAGGQNVLSMLASPLTKDLFHRAIAQSPLVHSYSPLEAHNLDKTFAQIDRGSWEIIEQLELDHANVTPTSLRAITPEDLLSTYFAIDKDHASPLVIKDGSVIPKEGLAAALADSRYAKKIPVMLGSNRDEVTLWLGLSRYFVDAEDVLFGLLPPKLRIKDPESYNYWIKQRGRGWKTRGVDDPLLSLRSAGYQGLYAYRFDWDEQDDNWFVPFSEVLGAAHGSEIAFVMGAPMYGSIGDYMYPDSKSAQALTEHMMQAWANFARDGSPGTMNNIEWPEFSAESPAVMVLDAGADQPHIAQDSPGLTGLLNEIAEDTNELSPTETCILVWELVTTIGEPSYNTYEEWSDGRCSQIDVRAEKAAINSALIEEYGSADVF